MGRLSFRRSPRWGNILPFVDTCENPPIVNSGHASLVQRIAAQSTGTATILVDKSGDNFILIVKGANGDLTPEDVERAGDDLKTCDLILLQFEVPLETVYAGTAFGRRQGGAQSGAGGLQTRYGESALR